MILAFVAKFRHDITWLLWIFAAAAMAGSLYFSEVMGLAPCVLCWYQRIALYPLVLLVPIGIAARDTKLPYYTFALSSIAFLIAVYHNLLYYNILPESIAPCTAGISCTTRFFQWFGFVTIPFLSLVASFVMAKISFLLILVDRRSKV